MENSSYSSQDWLEMLRELESQQQCRHEMYQADLASKMEMVDRKTREMVDNTARIAEEHFAQELQNLRRHCQAECENRRQYWQDQLYSAKYNLDGEVKSLLSTLLEEVLPLD